MKTFKLLLSLALLIMTIVTINSYLPHPEGLILGSLIFTAPGGIAAPFAFNMNYLPQFLTFNNVVPLTSLRVSTQEDGVLHDWVAASIAVINGYMVPGAQAANIVVLRVANGQLNPRNVTISGVTSAAGAIGFYEASDQKGTYPFKTTNAQILALNPTEFMNFTAIWVPAMAAVTDFCEIVYASGHKQTYNINDLAALSSYWQELPQIMVNNVNSYIHSAKFTCAAATPAYVLSVKI
jgi:hypothetical protein